MLPVSMDAPAELLRRACGSGQEVVIARGPLVILAHGLLALEEPMRTGCWIRSAGGDLDLADTQAMLRRWTQPVRH